MCFPRGRGTKSVEDLESVTHFEVQCSLEFIILTAVTLAQKNHGNKVFSRSNGSNFRRGDNDSTISKLDEI
jgi:hypothetical protein